MWRTGLAVIFLLVGPILAGCGSDSALTTTAVRQIRIDSDLKRGPYVQMGTTQSILVVWQTFSSTRGVVEYGLTEALGSTAESAQPGTTHAVSLTGLQPNTYYFYRILDGSRPLSSVVRFHTNHSPNDRAFQFLVFGDSGHVASWKTEVAKLINSSPAHLALHTGDVMYEFGEEQYYDERYFQLYAPFLASNVIYLSLGNHDLVASDGAAYFTNFYFPANNPEQTERYYSFDYGDAHFIALDTNIDFRPTSSQYRWLEQDLATTQRSWKFVYFHFPAYSTTTFSSAAVRQHLVPLFERSGVDVVFSGHVHAYERSFPLRAGQPVSASQEPDYIDVGTPIHVITGGGGAPLHEVSSSPLHAVALSVYHVVEIRISGSQLDGRVIGLGGTTLDTFSLRKNP